MPGKKNFLDRFIERVEDVDAGSRQAYILRLARERGFFETVFNAVEEGILVLDEELRIRYFNRAAKELLALPEDMENVRISQLIPSMDWKSILDRDAEAWTRLSRQEVEIAYPRQTFLQLYLVPHDREANLATMILRDVTESRKRTLDQLEQQTAQAVSMLAAGVAHEIGNPLNSLYLNLQLLEKPENLAPGEAAEMIRDCKKEVERLDNILTSFLAAIRPGKPKFESVDVRQLVLETLSFMQRELESRRITADCQWPETPLPRISGDPQQLKQAFFNIIKNALQAMTAGGKLRIAARREDESLVLSFSDQGSGMTKEQLGEMFTPFKTSKATGNGLGMMIIQRVCREHGAEFGVDSEPDAGTTVTIRFPLGGRRIRVLPG